MNQAKTVAIIGAGPVGLAAAAHVLERGLTPIVLEAGSRRRPRGAAVGPRAAVLAVGIQRRPRGRAPAGVDRLELARPEQYPTGAELVERYLEPLATGPRSRITSTHRAA